ncbi:hypothetical protein DPM19_22730 [Actinomadura craniellae]|uniref:DUF5753 domain-containing protein n=1 Tax=Actinomadura craniellae TaxID=2231787 RepID=A0A365H180_9ACTN|nr:DUF5753 domain-containing protein [Actinomadura craniellae]RAY12837.1 hypothetical protein DPM19_22730 [Actinomadura craniellae]
MALRELLDPDNSLWDWVAVDLHFYRTKHGLSCAQLGLHLKVNRQAVSNMEAGRVRLDQTKAKILDELWNLNDHFQRLVRYAKAGHDSNWFKAHLKYEAKASEIRVYERSVIPGLLQIEEYARALFAQGGAKDVEDSVRARLARQEALNRPDPPLLWVLLDEDVVDRVVGGAAVMRRQLSRLLEVSSQPNVMLRVVPRSVGFHLGLEGSFKVMTVGRETVAYVEACGGGRLVKDPAEVHMYGIRYDRIGTDALSRDSSRVLISRVLESMDERPSDVAEIEP